MNKIIIYGLILLFFYFILHHFILKSKEGLENSCITSSDASDGNSDNGCKTIAIQKNIQAAQYTKTKVKNIKSEIETLINKVSKLIKNKKTKLNKNTKDIETNSTNVYKMKQALKPDKN